MGSKRVQQEIHYVLIKVWDPVGVADIETAQDEYDSYIGKIYSLLKKGVDYKRLDQHLWYIEYVSMGLPTKARGRDEAIQALLKIKL